MGAGVAHAAAAAVLAHAVRGTGAGRGRLGAAGSQHGPGLYDAVVKCDALGPLALPLNKQSRVPKQQSFFTKGSSTIPARQAIRGPIEHVRLVGLSVSATMNARTLIFTLARVDRHLGYIKNSVGRVWYRNSGTCTESRSANQNTNSKFHKAHRPTRRQYGFEETNLTGQADMEFFN